MLKSWTRFILFQAIGDYISGELVYKSPNQTPRTVIWRQQPIPCQCNLRFLCFFVKRLFSSNWQNFIRHTFLCITFNFCHYVQPIYHILYLAYLKKIMCSLIHIVSYPYCVPIFELHITPIAHLNSLSSATSTHFILLQCPNLASKCWSKYCFIEPSLYVIQFCHI